MIDRCVALEVARFVVAFACLEEANLLVFLPPKAPHKTVLLGAPRTLSLTGPGIKPGSRLLESPCYIIKLAAFFTPVLLLAEAGLVSVCCPPTFFNLN